MRRECAARTPSLAIAWAKLEDAIDRIKAGAGDVPLIAVGGGAFLVPGKLAGVSEVIRVEHGDCANAVGAAITQISGEAGQVYHAITREDPIAAAEAQAVSGRLRPAPTAPACKPSRSRTCRSPICPATRCASGCGPPAKCAGSPAKAQEPSERHALVCRDPGFV
jgi:hypothetical protein